MSRKQLTTLGLSVAMAGCLAGAAHAQFTAPPTSVARGARFIPQGGWFTPNTFFFFPFRGVGSAFNPYPILPAAGIRTVGVFPFGRTEVIPDFRLGNVTATHIGPYSTYNWQPYPWTESYPISAQDAAMWDAAYDVGPAAQQQAMLDRLWTTVVIRIQPTDAAVQVDDHVIGTASKFAAARTSMRIPPGRYRFEASRPGYETYSTVVNLQPGEKFVLARKLTRTR